MAKTPTVNTNALIDINPNGITITLPSLDKDVAELINKASEFTVEPLEKHAFDTANVRITSNKRIEFVDREDTDMDNTSIL